MDALETALEKGQRFPFYKASATTVGGFWHTLFNAAGMPAAGSLTIGNTANGLVPDDTWGAGGMPITDFTGIGQGYLGQFYASGAVAGILRLYDRLFHAGSFANSTGQTYTLTSQPSFANRLPETDYAGVEMWLEMNAANGSGASTVSANYTDNLGNTGQVATQDTAITSFPAGRMTPFRLATTYQNAGVQKLESVTVGGTTGGTATFNVVLLRPLAQIPIGTVALAEEGMQDPLRCGLSRLLHYSSGAPNGPCLCFMFLPTTTSSGVVTGYLNVIAG
jgi:hypothetical protein